MELFNGFSTNGDLQFRLILKYNSGLLEDRLLLSVRQDDGSYVETPFGEEILVPDGWNKVEVSWETGSGTDAFDVVPFVEPAFLTKTGETSGAAPSTSRPARSIHQGITDFRSRSPRSR